MYGDQKQTGVSQGDLKRTYDPESLLGPFFHGAQSNHNRFI